MSSEPVSVQRVCCDAATRSSVSYRNWENRQHVSIDCRDAGSALRCV